MTEYPLVRTALLAVYLSIFAFYPATAPAQQLATAIAFGKKFGLFLLIVPFVYAFRWLSSKFGKNKNAG